MYVGAAGAFINNCEKGIYDEGLYIIPRGINMLGALHLQENLVFLVENSIK